MVFSITRWGSSMSIEIVPIKPHIGATVHVTRARLCDDDVVQQCQEALEKHGVLVFPRLGLTDAEQLAFSDRMGTRVNFTRKAPGGNAAEPDVYKVTLDREVNDQPEYVQGTFFWHMDGVTSNIPPPKATLLSARRLAPKGGQTEFASTFAAYENLPATEKADLAGLRAVHDMVASMRPVFDVPSATDLARWRGMSVIKEHPIVWKQRSGRSSMILGSSADRVVGMPIPDGRSLLARLLEWTAQPEFYYRHYWQLGDLVVWNNIGTLHRVIPYDRDSGRSMHRTSLAGNESVN
jgi:alpha-ketoglutarate-dependent taurine dioxygenase